MRVTIRITRRFGLMYVVVWKDPSKATELTSEEAVLTAEDQGLVTIERTDIVLNCPVIPFSSC